MKSFSLSSVADHLVQKGLAEAVANESFGTADVLAWIAEFDARKLYLPAAYPSMYEYCLRELHMSEDQAGKRIRAARAAREFPAIFEMVAEQRLSLSAVVTLVPKLNRENAAELLAAAAHKTRAEVELLLAERFPRSDAPSSLRAVPPLHEDVSGDSSQQGAPVGGPGVTVQPGPPTGLFAPTVSESCAHSPAPGRVVPIPGVEHVHTQVPLAPLPRMAPLSKGRYELRVTLDQASHDRLRRLQELLSHSIPSGDLAAVLGRAFEMAVEQLEKRRRTTPSRTGTKKHSRNARRIPTSIRRAVHERDGDQCTFVSSNGRRCAERRFLELDHMLPVARGGQATVANLRLRCRAHNQHEAERTYGAGFMREKRQSAKARAETASMLRGVAIERARMRPGAAPGAGGPPS